MCSVFFWVISRRPSFNSRSFGTLYQLHLHRKVDEVSVGMRFVVYLYLQSYGRKTADPMGRKSDRPGGG